MSRDYQYFIGYKKREFIHYDASSDCRDPSNGIVEQEDHGVSKFIHRLLLTSLPSLHTDFFTIHFKHLSKSYMHVVTNPLIQNILHQ